MNVPLSRALVTALLIACFLLPAQVSLAAARSIPSRGACAGARGAIFAFSDHDAVSLSGAGGGGICRLTTPLAAKEPALSPDHHAIAFLSGVGSGGDGTRAGNTVHLLSLSAGRSRDRVLRTDARLHSDLAWSRDSRSLAFLDGSSLWVWRTSCGCSRPAVTGSSRDPVTSFAWSPDSRRLVAYRAPQNAFPIARLPLSEFDVRTHASSTVWVNFPAGIGNFRTGAGSYPSLLLGWTASNQFLLGTSGWGIGLALTGIWSVPARGGRAQLVLGGRSHGYAVSNRVLRNASAALLSPGRTRLLVDAGSRFWLGTSAGEFVRWLAPAIGRSCLITQFSWISDATVAFVAICPTGVAALFSRLYTLSTGNGRALRVRDAHSARQDILSIAPRVACVACGAG